MTKCFVKEREFKFWLVMCAALTTRSIINFKGLGRPVSRKLHPVVVEDLLDASVLENWLQVCTQCSEMFCDKVNFPSLVISRRVLCLQGPMNKESEGEAGTGVEKRGVQETFMEKVTFE